MNLHRHGEVLLRPVKNIPQEAKLVQTGKQVIVGHSESGHHHVLSTLKVAGIKVFEYENKTYLDIGEEALLTHQKTMEKHKTQTIAPGRYERILKREYDYFEKAMKQVQD